MDKQKILILTDDLKNTCGISNYLYMFLSEYKGGEFDFYILCSGGDAVARFRKINAHVFVDTIFKEGEKSYYCFCAAIIKLISFIIKHDIKIVHAQNYYVANITRIASYLTKVKTIQTHHNFFKKTRKLKLLACDYQVLVNDDMYEYLTMQFPRFPKTKMKIVRYGIPLKDLRKPSNNQVLKVLNGGRLIPEKGTNIYLDALKLLPANIFNKASFSLAGEGIEKDRLLKRIEVEKINISYLGVLEPLIDYLEENDILIFTSQWDAEGFPMTILEAGMYRNLIITSNFRGLSPHFIPDYHGLVFTSNTPSELAEKIVAAVEDSSLRNELSQNFNSKVKDSFSSEKSVSKLIHIYQSLNSNEN